MNILVVDDTALFRRVMVEALSTIPDVTVVATAGTGKTAVSKILELKPDMVTLDLEMPDMNGLEVIDAIRAAGSDAGILMVSALTVRGGDLTIKALQKGAFDFITKPSTDSAADSLKALRNSLEPILRAYQRRREIQTILKNPKAASVKVDTFPVQEYKPKPVVYETSYVPKAAEFILIGVSTGGPNALAVLLSQFPEGLKVPVFIVLHMPPNFTKSLAENLQNKVKLKIVEASDGQVAQPGVIYIAPGGLQMKIVPERVNQIVIRINNDPPENNCKPAVDYLFRSAAIGFPGKSCAAILTGMGSDGTNGLKLLKQSKTFVVAQDELSCVVFGMPKAAIDAGVVDEVLPLDRIAGRLVSALAVSRQ